MTDHSTDLDRIAQHAARPALVTLHRALSRLGSVLTVMNSGAHPDDEQSGMLAWLRYGRGMRVVIACSTRGEGGQNILGPERGGTLGIIRTRELEEAARVLDADIAWLGHGPDDPVHDFGFSKDGDSTFARWGETRITARMVQAYRYWRPDIVIPTFLDVPGQHGHHRAMTRAAEAALAPAADPAQKAGGLAPWRVARFCLPAWSGGGATYDDELPPPPASFTLHAPGRDPATGAEWARIGEQSRAFHASQGMGRWPEQPKTAWALHLKHPAGGDGGLTAGLPGTLADLAGLSGPAEAGLQAAAAQIARATAAFPDRDSIIAALAIADEKIAEAEADMRPEFAAAHGHRLARKRLEIAAALFAAAGLEPRVTAHPARPAPGDSMQLALALPVPMASLAPDRLSVTFTLPEGARATPQILSPGDAVQITAQIADNAPCTPQFFPEWRATGGNRHSFATATAEFCGRSFSADFDFEAPVAVTPAQVLRLDPEAVIIPAGAASVPICIAAPGVPDAGLAVPDGWHIASTAQGMKVTPPALCPPGLVTLAASISGRPAMRRQSTRFAHIGAINYMSQETLRILTLDLRLPEGARIAYIGGGDRVGLWLARMGADVTILDRIAPSEDFARFTTVLVGVTAFGLYPDLPGTTAALHRFTESGGNLVTLCQRPDQGWDEYRTPPRHLRIGTPSLRWRVTDPAAPVTFLEPDHPLLAGPNRITADDFAGWDKERGIYFASDWDDAYRPLFAVADPQEQPLKGALISGSIGRGRHSHVAFVLHHQLDHLVPGAFRLLANLIAPAR